jgi:hypothetical protein
LVEELARLLDVAGGDDELQTRRQIEGGRGPAEVVCG